MTIDFNCSIVGFSDGRTRFEKTCDRCGKKSQVTRSDGLRSRARHNGRDYCHKCACVIKNSSNKTHNVYHNLSPDNQSQFMQLNLGFDNVAIYQGKNVVKSRLDVNISTEFVRGLHLVMPLIASNMSTVVNANFCIELGRLGALGVMHRALGHDIYIDEVKKIAQSCELVAASIGIGDSEFALAKSLINAGANIIVIDIAHGYCDAVLALGKKIKRYAPSIKLILGNTINPDMIYEADEFADGIKIGIAQGFACETKDTAGCTAKQFSAIQHCVHASKQCGIPLISDGGIRKPSDFTKAILAGANSVMAGSIFARCPSSAAPIINIDGVDKKVYAGMASRQVQNEWRGGLKDGTCPEGKTTYLDLGEGTDALLERYSGALRSGITYVGADNVTGAQSKVRFIKL